MPSSSDANKADSPKLQINGIFSNNELQDRSENRYKRPKQKYFIRPAIPFEIVELPDQSIAKLAYGETYDVDMPDLDIEFLQIAKYEPRSKTKNLKKKQYAIKRLKFHYKRVIALMSPKFVGGWNRWSENILDLFLYDRLHRVLWGSGNCGKSATYALLLYIKWRVKPHKRMVVIASKVVADAKARVFGYIKEIHAHAPPSRGQNFKVADGQNDRGIYSMIYDEKSDKWVKNDRACIVNLPVKVRLNKDGEQSEIGSNLKGKHPDEQLVLAFDEADEFPAIILQHPIFLNWYTNKSIEIHAWGNPKPVDYYDTSSHDLLYELGTRGAAIALLRQREKRADKTDVWKTPDSVVLRLSMLDSPQDDDEEIDNYIVDESGNKTQRLWFLGGKHSVDRIALKTSPNSPEWYSQVLGFPFIDTQGSRGLGVISPFLVQSISKYPLHYHTPENKLEYFMGVDPSASGHRDECVIEIARVGEMMDGREGIDWMGGKYCFVVEPLEQENEDNREEFVDKTIELMWKLSKELGIPLENIAMDTHGTSEVFRYAMKRHIEGGKWEEDAAKGQKFFTVSPMISPTDRYLFRQPSKMIPAKEMVMDIITEYWVAFRCAVMTRQMFNIPDFFLQQFYNRYLFTTGTKTKYKLETKEQMEKRRIKSPNRGDAACNVLEVMRRRGKFSYKFSDNAKYNAVYGPAQDQKKRQQEADQRMGIISSMLGLGLKITNGIPGIDTPGKRGTFDIDCI